ncbi:uncharacterized protein N7479_008104 [Penicillium vulpinum]|uniref:Uncharacterized protein n=1 Tax=Penicillium vulpinum TaxID=29845 RepID=A0A1V6R8Q1_9EURO|nr:uncharacterized protein N7479_008104 [Penicillium vulpinum]KAJ5960954.1 hypothetical protein N7479_008104 [Penicillium vulpinum]OQD97890.1 hypothetical protein PENVUL_c077G10268 [Penicillium vulpinum]
MPPALPTEKNVRRGFVDVTAAKISNKHEGLTEIEKSFNEKMLDIQVVQMKNVKKVGILHVNNNNHLMYNKDYQATFIRLNIDDHILYESIDNRLLGI